MCLLLKGGLVVDLDRNSIKKADVLLEDGKIAAIQPGLKAPGAQTIPVEGCYICPGFIDMHCHLREPGEEMKETILTGTRAAARGGFTAVVAMGNTRPPADSRAVIEFVKRQAETAPVPVYPVGCATKERKGLELAEIGDLVEAGIVALSDDGNPVMNSEVLRRVMEYSSMFDLLIISHCEDTHLSAGGVMHEGYISTLLGLRGIPRAAEEIHVARDIILAEMTGARLHIAHVSSAGSVPLIREAKQRGVRVTAEVTPHHLCLTDEAVITFDTNTKVNPPLRTPEDVEALCDGLQDGTIDVIATDHAPHAPEEKDVEYNFAPFGISGLETAVPLMWDRLVAKGILTPVQLVQKMAGNPAKILGLPERAVKVGNAADLTVIDPQLKQTVRVESFVSKGKNSPFNGWELLGWPVLTIVGGRVVMSEGKLTFGERS
ncbi:MAG TPA: dihydroorotase [Syntrophomonadaceae bacterium]|nr:dihydroorotase [Syntrophomonadaceae bacterium]